MGTAFSSSWGPHFPVQAAHPCCLAHLLKSTSIYIWMLKILLDKLVQGCLLKKEFCVELLKNEKKTLCQLQKRLKLYSKHSETLIKFKYLKYCALAEQNFPASPCSQMISPKCCFWGTGNPWEWQKGHMWVCCREGELAEITPPSIRGKLYKLLHNSPSKTCYLHGNFKSDI